VCLVVGDSFLVVDAAVQGDVDAEGQETHGAPRSRYATSRSPSGARGGLGRTITAEELETDDAAYDERDATNACEGDLDPIW
jgi:hypothetical protein